MSRVWPIVQVKTSALENGRDSGHRREMQMGRESGEPLRYTRGREVKETAPDRIEIGGRINNVLPGTNHRKKENMEKKRERSPLSQSN